MFKMCALCLCVGGCVHDFIFLHVLRVRIFFPVSSSLLVKEEKHNAFARTYISILCVTTSQQSLIRYDKREADCLLSSYLCVSKSGNECNERNKTKNIRILPKNKTIPMKKRKVICEHFLCNEFLSDCICVCVCVWYACGLFCRHTKWLMRVHCSNVQWTEWQNFNDKVDIWCDFVGF